MLLSVLARAQSGLSHFGLRELAYTIAQSTCQSTSNVVAHNSVPRSFSSDTATPSQPEPVLLCSTRMGVSTLTLNRTKQLNALNSQLMNTLLEKLAELDRSVDTRAIIITGSGKAFAAGADIKELAQNKSYAEVYQARLLQSWEDISRIRKPIIAAVNGPALGGGCELVMACDMAIASEAAQFGLPEVTLGLIPGGGGTQRLTRCVGKARAMDLILTNSRLSAAEAERYGIVSRVVKPDELLDAAEAMALKAAAFSGPVLAKAKECVNAAFETSLAEGLRLEKREFWSCFGLQDSREGTEAFMAKRKAVFEDK